MSSIILTKSQRAAIEKAKQAGSQRVRVELTASQQASMATAVHESDAEKEWILSEGKRIQANQEMQISRIAELLRNARKASGLSLSELAERTGMTRQAISRLESGENLNPTIGTLSRIAEALGMRWSMTLGQTA